MLSVTKSLNSVSNFLVSIDTHTSNSANFLNTINKYIIDMFSYISNISDYVRTITEYFETIFYMELQYINAMSDFLGLNFVINDSAASTDEMFTFNIVETLHQLVVNAMTEVENYTNPLSEQNKPAFDVALNNFKNNTFVGSCYTAVEYGNDIVNSMNVDSTSSIVCSTLPVKFFGINIPSQKINIDFSWYSPYRENVHTIISAFLWIGFLWRFITVTIFKLLNGSEGLLSNYEQINEPEFVTRDNFTIDDNGEVKSHSTVYSYKDGHTVTQKHKV